MVTTTIPGLNSRQLLGQLKRVQSDTLGFLMDCVQTYGDLVSFQAGPTTAVFVNQTEGVRHILQDNARNYSKDTVQYNALSSIPGRGLLTSDGDLWFRQRRLEQPAFSRARLAALDTFVVPAVQRLLDHWETHLPTRQSIDVDQHMMQVTLEIVGKALFSIDLSSQAPALTSAVLTTLDHIVHRARNPISLPAFLPTRRNLRFRAALSTLDAAVYDLMAARQEAGDPGDDMLGMLMKARDEETGQPMSERQVRDEVITLLIAGHETVASALTWTFHLLAANPGARQRLENEVHSVLGGRLPTTADLPNLPYTGWVFSEALRLEVARHGITVGLVVLGTVESSYWEHNPGSRKRVPKGGTPLTTDQAAQTIVDAVARDRRLTIRPALFRLLIALETLAPGLTARGRRSAPA